MWWSRATGSWRWSRTTRSSCASASVRCRRWPKGKPPEVRLVAEVLDQRNVHIAEMAGVDDFIVSDQLASLMVAQLSEHAELRMVFDELFDASGASIALRPAGRFSPNGSA